MSTLPRLLVALLGLASSQSLSAQLRTTVREPVLSTKSLTLVATATLAAAGGSALLANVAVRASAENVGIASLSVIGGPGELQIHAPIRTTGEPGSRLTVRSDAAMPSGTYTVSLGFTHARTGDAVRFIDGNTGTVVGSCTLAQQPNWNDVQPCAVSLALISAPLGLIVEPTAGVQLYPTTITVSQYR